MSDYTQTFTLKDIFNNPNLKGKIPFINYKETEKDGKLLRRTNMKTLHSLIMDNAKASAKPYYKPLLARREENRIVLDGTLTDSINAPYNAVYKGLLSIRGLMSLTVNNMEMIRSALKEGEKYGNSPKLYLRANSMQQIESMNKGQLYALIDDVMKNIYYNDDFSRTQKRFGVEKIQPLQSSLNYEQRKAQWQRRIGL